MKWGTLFNMTVKMSPDTSEWNQDLDNLFLSPEWCPLVIDYHRQILTFVQLSPERYQEYVFLSIDEALRRDLDFRDLHLDDVLLAAASTPPAKPRVHYVLHTAYCCSTLLARYFELLPGCVVLKEPQLLAQVALSQGLVPRWQDSFDTAVRLLSRIYDEKGTAVMKTHVPCNTLAQRLLEENVNATITYLIPQLRSFLLAALKMKSRRERIRSWNGHVARIGSKPPQLSGFNPDNLTDGEAAAYWWLWNRFLAEELCSQTYGPRVLVLNADQVSDSPRQTIGLLAALCGLELDDCRLDSLANHPRIRQHSKDPSRPYDVEERCLDMAELEKNWGVEADAAMAWVSSIKMNADFPEHLTARSPQQAISLPIHALRKPGAPLDV
jgi:hypothetical protein